MSEAEAESISSFHRLDRIHALLTDCRDNYHGEFHVLRDVDLTVGKGEAVDEVLEVVRRRPRDGADRAPQEFFTAPRGGRAGDSPSKILKH